MRGPECRKRRGETSHIFVCRHCRIESRLAASWRRFPRPSALEIPVPVSEDFVWRVTAAVSDDRRRRRRRRTILSVAAALLFFFLAGAGRESGLADTPRPEDSYSQLLAASPLESFLPD